MNDLKVTCANFEAQFEKASTHTSITPLVRALLDHIQSCENCREKSISADGQSDLERPVNGFELYKTL
ncbi:MAG: hypothetical protein O2794_00520 [bacterium]|nr:hypothetical protein [bacterium]